jgi:hypothetical protein
MCTAQGAQFDREAEFHHHDHFHYSLVPRLSLHHKHFLVHKIKEVQPSTVYVAYNYYE